MKRFLVLPLLTIALAWPASPATAASSVEAGWWTSAPVASPDVPSGGLAVQGGPDAGSPVSFSAVSFALDPGETAQSVTLGVTGNSATTPGAQLMVCPLTGPFSPASGGAMADAPKYRCDTKATASPSSDGKSYTFDVSGITATGALAVAILPTQPTDRAVFDAPTTSSLKSTPGAPASTTSDPSPSFDTGAAPSYSGSPSASGSFGAPSTPLPDVPGPANGSLGGSETPRATSTGSGATAAASTSPAPPESRTRVLVPLALGLAILAAALWLAAGADREAIPDLAEEAR